MLANSPSLFFLYEFALQILAILWYGIVGQEIVFALQIMLFFSLFLSLSL